MRKLFAGLAAAATMLGGLALGVSTANADDTLAVTADELGQTQSIVLQGDAAQLKDHTFKAVLLGAYDGGEWTDASKETLASVSVRTETNVLAKVENALKTIEGVKDADDKFISPDIIEGEGTDAVTISGTAYNDYKASVYKDNPVAFIARYFLGYEATDSGNTDNRDTTSSLKSEHYAGLLRDLVEVLGDGDDTVGSVFEGVADATTEYAERGKATVTISGLTPGIYIIMDSSTGDVIEPSQDEPSKYTASIHMLVGTKLAGKDLEHQELGAVAVKNELIEVNKEILKAKGEYNEEPVNESDQNVGDVIDYKLSTKVPNTTGYETKCGTVDAEAECDGTNYLSYVLTLNDTLSKGLTLNDKVTDTDQSHTGIVVRVAKTDDPDPSDDDDWLTLAEDTDYLITISDVADTTGDYVGGTLLRVDLSKWINNTIVGKEKGNAYIGKEIRVDYSATLNSDAVIGVEGNPNKVDLTYSNKPDGDSTGTIPGPEPEVFTFDFGFQKVAASDNSNLSGAKFSIKALDGKYAGKYLTKNDKGEWVPTPATDSKAEGETPYEFSEIADSDGRFYFSGLAAGQYEVEETTAPTGYLQSVKPKTVVTITWTGQNTKPEPDGAYTVAFSKDGTWDLITPYLSGDSLSTDIVEGNTADRPLVNIKNAKNLTELPLTGGAGIALFVVVGLLLTGAAVMVYAKMRGTMKALRV
ncbi:SpaA isopeptide-forming pilin-related protein [Bifidobacterium oedipodis]|nr:SpaA isopeptide-forming pilin-related protein [Bifidobacterium sp. DSM 109957]